MDPVQEQKAKKAAKVLKSRIDLIQKHLDPILTGPLSETYGPLPTNEKAQFEVLLSFTLNTLYHSKYFFFFKKKKKNKRKD